MGQNYALNNDNYVYAYGIGTEWDWDRAEVYLTRVPKDAIADYSRYTYFAGPDATGRPIWSVRQNDAQPLTGLHTAQMGSAMYHEGAGRYLFLAIEGLYEAPTPSLGSWPLYAVRMQRWKYIQTFDKDDPQRLAFEELYDLHDDPHEKTNLAGKDHCADRQAALREELHRLRDSLRS